MLRYATATLLAALTFTASAHADAGSPDPSFGTNGVQLLDTTGNQSESGVAVQADGKLVVINRGTNDDFARIHRLNDDGSDDRGFGDLGTVTINGTGLDQLNAVLVQPDGKILVGGRSGTAAVLYRFSAAGSPDQGFGAGGKVTLPPLTQFAENVFDLALRDGKIVAAGQSFTKAAVWKRNAVDGSADGATLITIPQGGDNDLASGVAIQPDGRIDVAGSTSAASNGFVARLNTTLGLDPTFQGGLVQINNGGLETVASIALQPDGKIVLAGRTSANVNAVGDIMVTRLTSGGMPDQSFNGTGTRFVDSGTNEFAGKVLVQPDGKLVITGSNGDVLFYRLTSSGANDNTFDLDGARGVDGGGADTSADAVLQPDGKIVSVGSGLGVGIAVRVFGDPLPLTVVKTGTGKGSVVSDPLGLNCGVKCTAGFDAGTRVKLTAVPNPGSRFTGWTGCDAAGATCTVDVRAATTVTASFAADAVTQNPGGGGTTGGGGGTTGGGGTPRPGAAPAITGATLSATRFRVSSRKTAISAAVKRGTSVRFTLSADAATTLTISKGGRTVMTLTRAKTTRGANLIAFTGRTAKKTLKPGRYRMTLVATAAGARSKPVTLSFSVLSGR
jgi:uncharacterized delta-60 repeat protein